MFRNKTDDVKKESEDDDRADLTANSHKRPASQVSLCFPFSCSSDDQHLKGSERNRPMCTSGRFVLFWLRFTGGFACGLEFLQETSLLQCFIRSFALRFFDKIENLAHNHWFLLQTKRKTADKTLEQKTKTPVNLS